tara:strand:+ start:40 stop:1101 length:1062 start_codon:yes stop_codon:yes gene_type:complete
MRYLITGGAGFIGGALVRKLINNKRNVVFNLDKLGYASDLESIDNLNKKNNFGNYTFLKVDLAEKENLYDAIESSKPDVIMHLAAESHVDRSIDQPDHFLESNIVGTFNLLQAAKEYWSKLKSSRKNNFRFHHISTDEVYGSLGEEGRFNEQTPYDPRSPYSASKASSDHLVRAWFHTYNFPILITNCSNNFGPWQFPEKLIPLVISKALDGKSIPIYGDGLNVRDWLFVDDHIDGLIMVIQKGKVGESYCIGGNGERTNKYVVELICKILDKRIPNNAPHSKLIEYVRDRPGHDKRYSIDSSKIQIELGWKSDLSFEKALEKTVDWYLLNKEWTYKILKKSDYQLNRLGKYI